MDILILLIGICFLCFVVSFFYLKGYLFGSPKLYRILKENSSEGKRLYIKTRDPGDKWREFACGDSDAINFLKFEKFKKWRDTLEGQLAIEVQGELGSLRLLSINCS